MSVVRGKVFMSKTLGPCPDCGAPIGERRAGCDIERCLKMATFEPIIVSSALTNGELKRIPIILKHSLHA
jgi:hypothetical protein